MLTVNNYYQGEGMGLKYVHVSEAMERGLADKVGKYCRAQEKTKSWVIKKAVELLLEDAKDIEITLKRLSNTKAKTLTSKQFRKKLTI